jgi:hypothetical protein
VIIDHGGNYNQFSEESEVHIQNDDDEHNQDGYFD